MSQVQTADHISKLWDVLLSIPRGWTFSNPQFNDYFMCTVAAGNGSKGRMTYGLHPWCCHIRVHNVSFHEFNCKKRNTLDEHTLIHRLRTMDG